MRKKHWAMIAAGLGLGLGVSAVAGVSTAQVPENLRNVAVQRAAQLSGTPASRLSVVTSATSEFQLQGKKVFNFKVVDNASGAVYGLTLDNSGRELNASQLQASERAALTAQNGRLAPALAQRLATTAQTQPIPVMIWLKQPSVNPPQRPPINSNSQALDAQVNSFFQQVDTQRVAAVRPLVASAVGKLSSLGSNIKTEQYSPVVYATLTPQAIRQVATWSEVDQVYEDYQVEPALDIARKSIRADVVNGRGITGSGVRVAQIEVGGRVATNNPYLAGITQDNTYVCSTPDYHGTGVAGIIRSTHPSVRGVAPAVSLWAGGSCNGYVSELQDRSTAAANWGAKALNLSLGRDSGRQMDGFARFFDDMVFNRFRTIVIAAGNYGSAGCAQGTSGNVGSPAVAYNVVTVGNIDDKNTISWSGDTMSPCSSWRDPISTRGDREKPEIAAPGTSFISTSTSSPWTGNIGSGTSYAAPMVTGVVAQMLQRNSSLGSWPETVKAILMTTAVQNVEGSARLSEYDGAGGVVADRADDLVRGVGGTWGGQAYSCSAASSVDVATMSLTGGQRTRATLVWHQNPSYTSYASQPSADLDLQIISPSGTIVTGSYSYDNTYEIVDFTPSTTGSYKLRVKKLRCDLTPAYIGWAWRKGS